ncbi:peptidase M13 [Nakamurella silvestris]|nr:peptidase M13 [Nakamurella silvestris]
MTADPTTSGTPRPQDDLFRHVNGVWLDEDHIPADQSMYGAFNELRDEAEAAGLALVEELAGTSQAPTGSPEQLIGDLYRSFMDTERVEELGLRPIADQLEAVAQVQDVPAFFHLLGVLQRDGVGGAFGFYVNTDPAAPDRYTANLLQGGLGLPDESYYRDDQYAAIRESYLEHIATMHTLAGVADPQQTATRILALETENASHHWDRVRTRDQDQTNNPMDRAGLAELLPAELWTRWLAGSGADDGVLDHVVVRQPSFFTGLAGLLTEDRLDDWKAWLVWRILRAAAPFGPAAIVEENFDFYGRTLSGTPELRERWKRGVGLVESAVGEALGEIYVQRHFPPAAKSRMDELVAYLVAAYRQEIGRLSWMSEATKEKALAKLAAFTPKVGYPAKWRDYSALVIDPLDLVGNARRSSAFELDREWAKIGSPVDRDEWFMTPQTVNAYYNPGMNEIVFPAAILRPPFFDPEASDAVNFGGIGGVIGHEIGHGFDDQGSKFDGTGAINDWWTPADRAAFEELTGKLIAQYSALEPEQTPGHQVNGALTVGENIGDLGGLGIAYQAWLLSLGDKASDPVVVREGARALFISWATVWRAKGREAEVLRRLAIDPHSPPEFRCNQVVRNLDEFYTAFDVTPEDAMWLAEEERVRIW